MANAAVNRLRQRVGRSGRYLNFYTNALYRAARREKSISSSGIDQRHAAPRRVTHISPAYFSDKSFIGGGERYATQLATAMAAHVDTVLVSFGDTRESYTVGGLRYEIYPKLGDLTAVWDPLCYDFLETIESSDVVHCHQFKVFVSNLAVLKAAALRKRVFVTDLGGVGYNLNERMDITSLVDGFLPISAYAKRMLPSGSGLPDSIIYGGVSSSLLNAPELEREKKALYVGRLLPHKGINYLIEGLDSDIRLDVKGRPYDPKYFELLQSLAESKSVRFDTTATDEDIERAYRTSLVTILPSVYKTVYGVENEMPELLGLVLLEGMAAGTAAICTDVASMPEIVEHEVSGFVVPPNDPKALGARVRYLMDNPEVAMRMGQAGRARVVRDFSWDAVARKCLAAYAGTIG